MMFFRGVCVVLFAMTLQEVLTETNYEITVKGLVLCILENMRPKGDIPDEREIPDEAVDNIRGMMEEDYACHCRLDGGASPDVEPYDAIDKVCKEYVDCLSVHINYIQSECFGEEFENIPVRVYNLADIINRTESLCDEKYKTPQTYHPCRLEICKSCDIDKITSFESEIKKVVSNESGNANTWYWRILNLMEFAGGSLDPSVIENERNRVCKPKDD